MTSLGALILAVLSAMFYGVADFLGGVAARRAPALTATVAAQGVGLVLVGTALLLFPAPPPSTVETLWGIGAGLTGSVGVVLLYYGFAVGRVSVVAPVTAVCSITIPVLVAFALGERPGTFAMIGIAAAIGSVALISLQDDAAGTGPRGSRSVLIGLAAGLGIGAFFVCLARSGTASGLWPLVIARGSATVALTVAARLAKISFAMPRNALLPVLACGALDVFANGLFVVATRTGPLGLVATLASLYPASTVLLARIVLGERLRPVQAMGLACAGTAIVLISSR